MVHTAQFPLESFLKKGEAADSGNERPGAPVGGNSSIFILAWKSAPITWAMVAVEVKTGGLPSGDRPLAPAPKAFRRFLKKCCTFVASMRKLAWALVDISKALSQPERLRRRDVVITRLPGDGRIRIATFEGWSSAPPEKEMSESGRVVNIRSSGTFHRSHIWSFSSALDRS